MSVKIDKGVPLPDHGAGSIYSWERMEVGDSFAPGVKLESARAYVRVANKGHSPKKFFAGVDHAGKVRIWRVADVDTKAISRALDKAFPGADRFVVPTEIQAGTAKITFETPIQEMPEEGSTKKIISIENTQGIPEPDPEFAKRFEEQLKQ